MPERVCTVPCTWDAGAAVWVAASDDVPGLATGADSLDARVEKLKVVIAELLEVNGLGSQGQSSSSEGQPRCHLW